MKSTQRYLIAIGLLITLVMSGCATLFTPGGSAYRAGKRAMNSKNYAEAVDKTLEALEINPEFPEAQAQLPMAFNGGVSYYKSAIETAEKSGDQFRYDKVRDLLEKLYRMNESIKKAGRESLGYEDYQEQLTEATQKAAEAHYQAGSELLAQGDYKSGRQAAGHFNRVRGLISDYKDTAALLDEAVKQGTVYIAIYTAGSVDNLAGLLESEVKEKGSQSYTKITESIHISGNRDTALSMGRSSGADFVLFVKTARSFDKVRQDNTVPFPENSPAFTSLRIDNGYRKGFTASSEFIDAQSGRVLSRETAESKVEELISISLVKAEGMKELNLGDAGTGNYRYVKATGENFHTAMSTLQSNALRIATPSGVVDESNQTEWHRAFMREYDGFADLKEAFDGLAIFYDVETVQVDEIGYAVLGGGTFASARQNANRNVAIYNGIAYTIREFLKDAEKEDLSREIRPLGEKIAASIKAFL